MIWFTSDTHYGHNSIISLCNRPFANLDEMHEHLIAEWNKRVKSNETVYVLGDFSFAGQTTTKEIAFRLQGKKILITGNHDRQAKKMLALGFDEVHENIYIHIGNKQKVYLSHFPFHPMTSYNKSEDGTVKFEYPYEKVDTRYMHKRIVDDGESWLLCGHVHGSWAQLGRQINVGVDVRNFAPVSHEKILKIIAEGPKFVGKSKDDYGD